MWVFLRFLENQFGPRELPGLDQNCQEKWCPLMGFADLSPVSLGLLRTEQLLPLQL